MSGSLYDRVADLPLRVESAALDGLALPVSSVFHRRTTVVRLSGAGHDGVGEDVNYNGEDQQRFQSAPPLAATAAFDGTFGEYSARLDEQVLIEAPSLRADVDYRRWAFESAALDLALRQDGTDLARLLGRSLRPLSFVVSLGLGPDPTLDPIRAWLAVDPGLRFKVDASSAWTRELVEGLAELGVVEVVDLKGAYVGTPVDQPADPNLYRLVVEGLPKVWVEDPAIVPSTASILDPHRDRITWDAPIHSVADIEKLSFEPKCLNIKPSRFGSVARLFAAYEYCAEHGIALYGGGQFELGPGRDQIQRLAALMHADAPNDTSPIAFHRLDPEGRYPTSPMDLGNLELGFGRP